MIKHINPQNILTTPFIAAKSHVLSNTQNSDAIVLEQDGTTTIALDYVNYNFGIPFLNSDCNIALEQQFADAVAYQEGVLDTDTFNSSSSPRNADGTYKGLVHRTTKNAFYNTYNNPTKIFGVEHIDFALSNTLRNITDQFRMFSLTPLQFGDKIEPKSVRFYDTLFDDNVTVFDDGCQNLIAGFNLFSKVQEVRIWSSGSNPQVVLPGTTSYTCPSYDSVRVTNPQDAYCNPGANATFSVTASGDPVPIILQWFTGSIGSGIPLADGGRILGSTGPTLSIFNIEISDAGTTYYVTAHNHASSSATSSIAHVYLYPSVLDLVWTITSSSQPSINYLTAGGENVYFYAHQYGPSPLQSSAVTQFDNPRAVAITIRASWIPPNLTNPHFGFNDTVHGSYTVISVNGTQIFNEQWGGAGSIMVVEPWINGTSSYADIVIPAYTNQTITVLNQSNYDSYASGYMVFAML